MARVWIARHLPHASGHGHPLGAQKKKRTHTNKKRIIKWGKNIRSGVQGGLLIIAFTGDSTSSTC